MIIDMGFVSLAKPR